jgi:hypothetical protein
MNLMLNCKLSDLVATPVDSLQNMFKVDYKITSLKVRNLIKTCD